MKVDLSELRALEQDATPGPFRVIRRTRTDNGTESWSEVWSDNSQVAHCADDENADAIAAILTAAPALLDAYAERDRLREALTRERVAEAIWSSLIGDTHDGSEPIDGIAMKYSSPDVRNRIYRMTDAVSALLTNHSEEGR